MTLPIVIDTDPGVDDAVALALAARSPELEIQAVTTTYGTAPLSAATRNAREILRLCGRSDIEVLPGCERPLKRPLQTAQDMHGESGVGRAAVPDTRAADSVSDPHVLLEVLSNTARPAALVTIGPLTNLASALRADEALVRSRVSYHIGMFGALRERGRSWRRAEFNAWSDPEAVASVLHAGLRTTMVGLDVTRQMVVAKAQIEAAKCSQDPVVVWLGEALGFYFDAQLRQGPTDGCIVHDVLAVGEILDPGLLTCGEFGLTVDLSDGEDRGHTRVDACGSVTKTAVSLDVTRMRSLLGRVFGPSWMTGATTGGH